jgi:hypothetical protein
LIKAQAEAVSWMPSGAITGAATIIGAQHVLLSRA